MTSRKYAVSSDDLVRLVKQIIAWAVLAGAVIGFLAGLVVGVLSS